MKRYVLGVWGLGLIILFVASVARFAVGELQQGFAFVSGAMLWLVLPIAIILGVVVFRSVLLEEQAASRLLPFTVEQLDELISDDDLPLTDDD